MLKHIFTTTFEHIPLSLTRYQICFLMIEWKENTYSLYIFEKKKLLEHIVENI